MLSHYSALKVAENFRMLETLFPGGIDLGVGRAPGSDQLTAIALAHGPGALGIEHFPAQIRDLLGYLDSSLADDHPFSRIDAMPSGPTTPEFWLLGASDQSAAYAAHFGCAFSFAHFINPQGGPQVVSAYREHFQPAGALESPRDSIGVFVLCADTEADAARLMKSRDLWMLRLTRGETSPMPTFAEAESYPYTERERAVVEFNRRRVIVGAPEQVRTELDALGAKYGIDEFVVVTICPEFEARLRSYEMLAEVYALEAQDPAPSGQSSVSD